jgi:hypothetical protein
MSKSNGCVRSIQFPRALFLSLSLACSGVLVADGQDKPKDSPAKSESKSGDVGWRRLFDGKSLTGWKLSNFAGNGEITVDPKFGGTNSALMIGMGSTLSGLTWTNGNLPTLNYEVTLEGQKLDGSDFWCGLTFPVADSWATLVLGGWGGATVGISSIDGNDASENDTTKFMNFEKKRWYKVRLLVTKAKIEVWIDGEKMVDQELADHKISMRFGEIEESKPFGIATYQTSAAFRELKLRSLPAK